MKLVLLAGGLGTRISEESQNRPKPMVEIGGMPILWHIMKLYSHYGINEFIICCGYKGFIIKEYFANYCLHRSDVTFDLVRNHMEVHRREAEPWVVTLVDTGLDTMTGGRLSRVKSYLQDDVFCMTYGDGLADVNINSLINFHHRHGKLATLTSVLPPGRFGHLDTDKSGRVVSFREKPQGDGARINAGFFVLSPQIFDYLPSDDSIVWEHAPLMQLANLGDLMNYEHNGFWYAMDTLRDKNHLEDLWAQGVAPWKVW